MSTFAYSFNSGVYNLSAQNPAPLLVGPLSGTGMYNLSGGGYTNQAVQLLAAGSFGGAQTVGILFNNVPSAGIAGETITAPGGCGTVRLAASGAHSFPASAYFAFVNANNDTVVFQRTAPTTFTFIASGQNVAVDPDTRRKVALGYL